MFRYDDTKKSSQPGEAQRKYFTKIRKVTYYNNGIASYGYEPVQEKVLASQGDTLPETVGNKTVVVEPVPVKMKRLPNDEE